MKKIISFLLSVVLLLSLVPILPVTQAAAEEDRGLLKLGEKETRVAPGVTQTVGKVRKKYNDATLNYFALTVDTNNPYVKIMANYKDNEPCTTVGLQTVRDQMTAAQKKFDAAGQGWQVVGGINGTGYNMSTGETRNLLVMNGVLAHPNTGNEAFFAMLEDENGKQTPFFGWNGDSDYNANKDKIKEAVGIFGSRLIVDGKIVPNLGLKGLEPRTAIGRTEDNKVVMLVVDGRQAPASEGCDMQQLADILLDMGCVEAFNLDGGGSSTILSRPEGESTFRVINSPSDGFERIVSASWMVVSTAPDSNTLDHVSISTDTDYITPGGTVYLEATGISPAGTQVDIPETAEWKLDSTSEALGTISPEGIFTANDQDGEVKVQYLVDGEVKGYTTIHVVKPNLFSFRQKSYAVPYGKTIDFAFDCIYKAENGEEHEVTFTKKDIELSLSSENIGELKDFSFTACGNREGAPTSGSVTAKLICSDITVEASLTLGRGSEVLFDFDNKGAEDDFSIYLDDGSKTNLIEAEGGIASVETGGKAHSGSKSYRITIDWSKVPGSFIGTSGYGGAHLRYAGPTIDVSGAVGIGMWVWMPDEELTTNIKTSNVGTKKYVESGWPRHEGAKYDSGHWFYIHADYDQDSTGWKIEHKGILYFYLYNTPADGSVTPVYPSLNNKLTFYIDDITVDYSSVIDDRNCPEIKDVKITANDGGLSKAMERNTTTAAPSGKVGFSATAADMQKGTNISGIDENSVVAFIDGEPIAVTYRGGQIVTSEIKLAAGAHTVELGISDKAGNYSNVIRRFTVSENADVPTVQIVKQDPDADRIPLDSVLWLDVKATNVKAIDAVEFDLNLNNLSTWELEHAVVDPKFELSWELTSEYENTVSVSLTRRPETVWEDGDSDVIASLPIRTWVFDSPLICAGTNYTPEKLWSDKRLPREVVTVDVDYGKITYAAGMQPDVLAVAGGGRIEVNTELFGKNDEIYNAYPGATRWHKHTEQEPVNQAATCTTDGYTNRTYCETCKSVVDWGETQKATGHHYELVDGVLKCTNEECGQLYNGVWTDQKLYKDGETVKGWQPDNTYYDDGVKLGEGVQQVEETYYSFNEDGVCTDKNSGYTGYFKTEGESLIGTPMEDEPSDAELAVSGVTYWYTEAGKPRPGFMFYSAAGEVQKPTAGGGTQGAEGDDPTIDEDRQDEIESQRVIHVGTDGKVHVGHDYSEDAKDTPLEVIRSVHTYDARDCTHSNFIFYTCLDPACKATTQSELLWANGHHWEDPDSGKYVCTKCGTVGINIEDITLTTSGKYFTYTGQAIRAAHTGRYGNRILSLYSDRRGIDGLSTYTNNIEIGVATLTVEGRGDFYGTKSVTFEIVPADVKDVKLTEGANHELTLSWEKPLGAEFYSVWNRNADGKWEELVAKTTETSVTLDNFELGDSYYIEVGSRADAPDVTNGGEERTFYSANWSNILEGTIKHIWGEPEDGSKEADCENAGRLIHTCTICGEREDIDIPAKGHNVEKWEIEKEATTSAPGSRTGECTVCGEMVTEEIPQLPYVSPGASGGTDPSNKTETVTNPDGSTTTTTTYSDGSVTETTTQTDGTVTEKNTDKDGVVTEKTVTPDNTVTEKVTQTDGSATERTTTPDGVVGQTNTDAEGEVTSAEVVIPKEAEKQDVVTAPVEVPASKSAETAPEISVRSESAESTKVEIPVTEFGPGTAAVVVNPDGTEEIVRDCVIGENGVILNVEGDVTLKIVDKTETFEDVEPAHHWASDAVEFVAARELFKGTGANKFTPNGAMTRGMMVTVLYRLAYEPDTVAEQFEDVPSGQYYTDAVAWAQNAGVVTGYTDSEFGPNDNVKREQLVTILYRYAKKMGYATTSSGTLAGYADASSVSGWAKDAMSWAVSIGLVNGVDKTHLAPANNATRAEVATILMRFCEKVVK